MDKPIEQEHRCTALNELEGGGKLRCERPADHAGKHTAAGTAWDNPEQPMTAAESATEQAIDDGKNPLETRPIG
jgi:hypothetical protein